MAGLRKLNWTIRNMYSTSSLEYILGDIIGDVGVDGAIDRGDVGAEGDLGEEGADGDLGEEGVVGDIGGGGVDDLARLRLPLHKCAAAFLALLRDLKPPQSTLFLCIFKS